MVLAVLGAAAAPGLTAATLGNFVWDDRDGDGAQDAGEPGLEGITIQLWDSAKTQLLASTVTNAAGDYSFSVQGRSSYRLRVLLPSALDRISPKNQAAGDDTSDSDFDSAGANQGFTDIVSVLSGLLSITSVDCGLLLDMLPGHTIGNQVFRALPDGTQPAPGTAPSLAATVELLSSTGTVLQTTTMGQLGLNRGYYGFNAPPGTYRLRFSASGGTMPTPFPNAGVDDTLDSDIDASGQTALFTLAAGQIIRDLDAGFVFRVILGNFVWNDLDADGVQEPGEPGVPNVVLELWDAAKTRRWHTTVTNAAGNYTLLAPGVGDYRIWVLRPLAGDGFAPLNNAADDQSDSDIITSGGNFGFTDIISVASNVISITNLDAGLSIPVGARTIPPLRITNFDRLAPSLRFTGPAGGTYQLEHTSSVGSWTAAGSPIVTGSETTVVPLNPAHASSAQQFWRVRRTR